MTDLCSCVGDLESKRVKHYDEAKKMSDDTKLVRVKENMNLSHGGPSQRQASDTNQQIKALRLGRD